MSPEPSELGDEAPTDELDGVNGMLAILRAKGVKQEGGALERAGVVGSKKKNKPNVGDVSETGRETHASPSSMSTSSSPPARARSSSSKSSDMVIAAPR